jgi:hypothetical protein
LKKEVLLRAARSAAVHGDIAKANEFLAAARQTRDAFLETIAEARLLEANGDRQAALRLLRDLPDADARSVVLDMLWKEGGGDAVRARLASAPPLPLTIAGLGSATRAHLELGDFQAALTLVEQVSDAEIREQAFSLFQRGLLRFASLFPVQQQVAAFSGIPLDVRSLTPALHGDALGTALDRAADDFSSLVPVLHGLGLPHAEELATTYQLWCGLLHPTKKQAALDRLRKDIMATPAGVALAQFAIAFDPAFDADALRKRLDSRQQLGGLDDDELRAALIVALHEGSAADVAAFINLHRQRLYRDYGVSGTVGIEIQALAKSGEADRAQRVLDANLAELPAEQVPLFRADIAAASGGDQVAVYLSAYAETKSPGALRNAVHVLAARRDFNEHAKRAEELFTLTAEPEYLVASAWSNARAGNDDDLIRQFTSHWPVLGAEMPLRRYYAWALMRVGDLGRSISEVTELKKSGIQSRDLDLELALAVETGQWAMLPEILRAFLDPDAGADGRELLRAAQVAQASQTGPLFELLSAAVAKAPQDPQVLINAYSIVVEEGIEDARPQASAWFQAAVELSGPDGPVRTVDLQDIVEQQRARAEGVEKIGAAVTEGEMPLLVAGPGAGISQTQIILGSLVRNSRETDPRRKGLLALFSGSRLASQLVAAEHIVLDVSALGTLGWLGLLPTVLASYDKIGIAAGTLSELFNARHRIVQRQKLVIRNAQYLDDAVKRGKVKVVPQLSHDDSVAKEVGTELAALLHAAETSGGFVVHPPPVHRLGSFTDNATLGPREGLLADMHGLVAFLAAGSISGEQEESARRYLDLQVQRWPTPPALLADRPLYLDSLAISYLQIIDLLDETLEAFEVWIDSETAMRAAHTVTEDNDATTVLGVIDALAATLAAAVPDRVSVGKLRKRSGDEDSDLDSPSLNLLADVGRFGTAVFDDRALNKEPFAADEAGRQARMASTLDLLVDLEKRQVITPAQHFEYLRKLRKAGVALIPITEAEVAAAVRRSGEAPSLELRTIWESIHLARMARLPRFPAEIPWFANSTIEIKNAIFAMWDDADRARAAKRSDLLHELLLDPEDWWFAWHQPVDPSWAEASWRAVIAGLGLPMQLKNNGDAAAFNAWAERQIWAPMRAYHPKRYAGVIAHLKSFIASSLDALPDEEAVDDK